MSSFQKVIKYLAISFAIFLIVTIASAIVTAGYGIFKAFGLAEFESKENFDHSKYDNYLDINIRYSSLKIISGDVLKVENTNNKIRIDQDANKLYITDNSDIFSKDNDKEVIIYVPNIKFDIVSLNTGSGKVTINGLETNSLNLNLGAGRAKIKNIKSDSTKIDTGTGSVKIENSVLNNAKLNLGIGSINIHADITGDSHINCGIGSVNLNLTGTESDYTFDVEKGIGSVNVNGYKVENDNDYIQGGGPNHIKVEGGIGSVNINTNT